ELTRKGAWAGHLLGFALSGFFDGILLHQVLQWHHLLLGVQAEPFRDMRVQILVDGLFHVLMYAIALGGLWSLWRGRESPDLLAGRKLMSRVLIGFGAWHVLDAVVSHWLLGIHRIKMDSPNPLAWDLLWFVVFGIVPIVAGLLLGRSHNLRIARAGYAAAASLVLAVLIAGPIAAIPSSDNGQVLVVVRPSDASRLLDGLDAVSGSIMWADRSAAIWVLSIGEGARRKRLYEHGALLVTRSPAVLGCLAWTKTSWHSPGTAAHAHYCPRKCDPCLRRPGGGRSPDIRTPTRAAFRPIGVGEQYRCSPPSEPYGRFSRIRLSGQWLSTSRLAFKSVS